MAFFHLPIKRAERVHLTIRQWNGFIARLDQRNGQQGNFQLIDQISFLVFGKKAIN